MAPVKEKDVHSMVSQLKGRKLLEGFRGADPVDLTSLGELVIHFSELVMDLEEEIASIDLNPVMCTSRGCVVADARIILSQPKGRSG
jgi:acyl-CoA synthetase (NDP forming)